MRTKERIKRTAEIFTPAFLVNEMLDKLTEYGPEIWEEDNTFLDPACGNGNFLIEILKRKLDLGHNPLIAVKTIYGLDIMQDNIIECKDRLINLLKDYTTITQDIKNVLDKNIKWLDTNIYPKGTLDYDMSFE